MTKKNKQTRLAYRVVQINSLHFSYEDIADDKAKQLFEKEDTLVLGVNTGININQEQSMLMLDIETQLKEKEDALTPLIKHTGRTIFEIKNMPDFYNEKEKVFELPDELMVQLFALAYSHARALLAIEVSPTIYKEHFMLPVIDPYQFLKDTPTKIED